MRGLVLRRQEETRLFTEKQMIEKVNTLYLQPGDVLREIKFNNDPSVEYTYVRSNQIIRQKRSYSQKDREQLESFSKELEPYNFIGHSLVEIKISSPNVIYIFDNGASLKFPLIVGEST